MTPLWQCTLFDTLTDYPYADSRVYRTKEDAEKRAKRMTYWEDEYVHHWATVHSVKACWGGGGRMSNNDLKNVDKEDSAAPTASVGSLDERIEGQTDSLFSGILSMLDSHHKMLKDHEEALLIVADTENKATDAINVSLWLGVVATAIAVLALALEVLA